MNDSSYELVWTCIDDVSTFEEDDQLCRQLLSDPGVAVTFAEQARMHASLDTWFQIDDVSMLALEAIESRPIRAAVWTRFAWAAAALLVLVPLLFLATARTKLIEPSKGVLPPGGVARRSYQLAEGTLKNPSGTNEVIEGELLEVPKGSQAKIVTPNGTEALLKSGSKVIFKGEVAEARQVIEIRRVGGMFKVPPGKGEFRIETPVGQIVVLGTEFSVELTPRAVNWYPSEGVCMMKNSATLLAVAVVFGSVEVRIGDETYTLGTGDSRVFSQELDVPVRVDKKVPPTDRALAGQFLEIFRMVKSGKKNMNDVAPKLAQLGITWQKGLELLKQAGMDRQIGGADRAISKPRKPQDLTGKERKIAGVFLKIFEAAKAEKITREDVRAKLAHLGITWEEGMTLLKKTGDLQPKLEVLARWNGTWLTALNINPCRWVPEGLAQEEIKESKWILNGRFQDSIIRSDNQETRLTARYDPRNQRYQLWTFDTNGGHGHWLGKWNEKQQTMTWDFQAGQLKGTMTESFSAEDRYVTTVLIKDAQGETLLDLKADHMRILKGPRVKTRPKQNLKRVEGKDL